MKLATLSLIITALFFSVFELQAQPFSTPGKQVAVKIQDNTSGYGFYEYLPQDFSMTSGKKFPVVIFYHGIGEKGNGNQDLPRVLKNGPPKLIERKGKHFPAIVISPQSRFGWFGSGDFERQLNFLIDNGYPVDTDRVYVTGLSAGGGGTWKSLEGAGDRIAAVVPVCGANRLAAAVAGGLLGKKVWAFHNFFDGAVSRATSDANVNSIVNDGSSVMDKYPFGPGKTHADDNYTLHYTNGAWKAIKGVVAPQKDMGYTIFNRRGHNAWTATYDSQEMWDWLFAQSLATSSTPALTANAGSDKRVQKSTTSVTFTGGANQSVTSYKWRKISGPNTITIENANTGNLKLSAYGVGVYTFELEVTNASGAKAKDTVVLTVRADLTVDAGTDKSIDTDVNSLIITATTNRPATRYNWVKLGGPTITLRGTSTTRATLSDFVEGTYIIRITAFDEDGNRAVDDVRIEVAKAFTPLPPLTVNVGNDRVILSTVPELTLTASPSRTVTSYQWIKKSGPLVRLQGANTANLKLKDYVVGTFIFKVTVTASDGAASFDEVRVTVNAPPLPTLTVNAGSDESILDSQGSLTLSATPSRAVSSYQWTKISGPAITQRNATTKNLLLSNFNVGNYDFEILVTDARGNTAKDRVKVSVSASLPTLTVGIGPDKEVLTTEVSLTLTASPNRAVTAYRWTKINGPSITLTGLNSADLLLKDFVVGTYNFKVVVTDASGDTAEDFIRVVAKAPLPVLSVSAGPDKAISTTMTFLEIRASANRRVNSYTWTKESGPTVNMQGQTAATLKLSSFSVGTYNFKIKVTSTNGQSAEDFVKVTVTAPLPPLSVTADNKTVDVKVGTVTITATTNRTVNNYEWIKLRGPAVTATGMNTRSLVLQDLKIGTYEYRVKVKDASNRTAIKDVVIRVISDDIPPLVYAGADRAITRVVRSLELKAMGNRSVISYEWKKVSGPAVTMGNSNQQILQLSDFLVGSYTFQVTVANSIGQTATDKVKVMVTTTDIDPEAVVKINENKGNTGSFVLDGIGSNDSDGEILKYEWSISESGAADESLSKQILINFSDKVSPAAWPWNNTSGSVVPGVRLEKAIDSKGFETDIQLTFLNAWGGSKPGGVVSGNESGPAPDDVMNTFYWFERGQERRFMISGLVPGNVYDFEFIGSRDALNGDKETVYASQGQSAALDALNNANKTVSLVDLIADVNGEIEVVVSNGTNAEYAYLNAMIISTKGFLIDNNNASMATLSNLEPGSYEVTLTVTDNDGNTGMETVTLEVPVPPLPLAGKQGVGELSLDESLDGVLMYPNPSRGIVNLESGQDRLKVMIMDASGKTIKEFDFNNFISVDLTGNRPGLYLIKIYSDVATRTMKLMLH